MGFRDLVLFYIVSGTSLRWIAAAGAAGPSSITIWVFAFACFYIPLALSCAELSGRYPDEGGLYVWSKKAFGDFSGFMAAWTYWMSNLPYFPAILYFAASNLLFVNADAFHGLSESPGYFIAFSLIALAVIAWMNIVGLGVGKWLHNIGAIGMWGPALIVIVIGVVSWAKFGSATSFAPHEFAPTFSVKNMIFWASLTFAFGGAEAASMMSGEIKDPQRNIPRAMLLAGMVITASYILGTVALLLALPNSALTNLDGLMQAISASATRLHLVWIIPLSAILIAVGNLGAAGAFLAASARLPFAAGLDNLLPKSFGRLHPRWGTPYIALIVQVTLGGLFALLGQAGTSVKGAYDVLVSIGIITYFIPYVFLFLAMIRLQSEPMPPGAFRVPGGKPVAIVLALIGLTTTLLAIGLAMLPPPDEPNAALALGKIIGTTVIVMLLGAWLFFWGRRRAAAHCT